MTCWSKQNMGGMGNASYQPSQHKIDNLKKTMINKVIEIVGIAEVNRSWSRISIKDIIYNRTDGWFKTSSISAVYNRVANSDRPFQSGDTAIMAVDEVSCRVIKTGQEFRNMGCWSWMLLQVKKNVRTRIITAYWPTVSASAGGAYIQQLEQIQ